jgi:hypothetical protein
MSGINETIGQIESQVPPALQAVEGLASRIADGFKAILGTGEHVAQVLGLAHVAGIFEKVATGEDSILQKVNAGENTAQAVAKIAQDVTPAAIASVIVPESGKVVQQAQNVFDFVNSHTNASQELKSIAAEHFHLAQLAHEIVLGAETATDIIEKIPFFPKLGIAATIIASINAGLHFLEPALANLDSSTATPAT